jgi:DNA-binding response OmpR family regulator
MDAGFDAYLVKPVDPVRLEALIEGWTEQHA